ncbi:unnamed protein product [Adineta ricciae]|uniref:LIM zinc-binding domain-containing protein n=1 Tax=Adineta ricciae TaxID=249248 RepID=A0A815AIB4_ADIRI|nr:unnamed protein product [Adineta ricciae]CAF1258145.1 unnamed protein product [Adineta ricciae]
MNPYRNVRQSVLEAQAYQEDVITSSWVPAPPRMSERRSSNHTFTHPTDRVYKSELTIAPSNSISTKNPVDKCYKCSGIISRQTDNDIKFNNRIYHTYCFSCSICRVNLGLSDEKTFLLDNNGEPICKSCSSSKIKQCQTCRQAVISERYIHFDANDYHRECFNCYQCRRPLVDQVNIRVQNSRPCCDRCYDEKFASRCYVCNQTIPAGQYTTYKGNKYHLDCFKCSFCQSVIREMEFPAYNNKPCCERCYQDKFAPKCMQCSKSIVGEKAVIFNDNKYHADCFRCSQCYQPITESKFHMHNSKPCCNECFDKNIAPQCQQCLRAISVGKSVIYNGKSYHPDCFRCGQCRKIMYESRFYQVDNKPCCSECHEKNFTSRCAKCDRSIVDFYTTYKGKHYHTHCFVCSKCRRIIEENEKFYDDRYGILCSRCGL